MALDQIVAVQPSERKWILKVWPDESLMTGFNPGVILNDDGTIDIKPLSHIATSEHARSFAELLNFVADIVDAEKEKKGCEG